MLNIILYVFLLINNTHHISQPVNIGMFGDIMLSRKVGYFSKKNDFNWIFSEYNPFQNKNVDIWIGNLESTLVYKNDNDFSIPTFMFRANYKNINILQKIKNSSNGKILILNLANNHIRNGKIQGFLDTKKILEKKHIYFVGVGKNPKESHKILKINYKNNKLCFQGYSYDGSFKWGLAVNSLNSKYILKDLKEMKKMGCNQKIIFIHWGLEYKVKPTKFQKKLAHKLIDNGADIILGGHSHILGKIERYKGKIIIYSLGNTIFDQNWGETYRHKTMDCIKNKKGRCVVPTFIGTLLTYNTLIKIYSLNFHKIDFGKIKELKDNILKNGLKKIAK